MTLRSKLLAFDKRSVVQAVSGLLLLPENAPYQLRLEYIANLCLTLDKNAPNLIRRDELEAIVTTGALVHAPGVVEQEDPSENLFIQQVRIGQYIFRIFPGLNEGITFDLQSLLQSLGSLHTQHRQYFVWTQTALILMQISDRIAERTGLGVNTPGAIYKRKGCQVPGAKKLQELAFATNLSKQEVQCILKKFGASEDILNPFLLDLDRDLFQEHSLRRDGFGPFHVTPIVSTSSDIMVPIPSALATALRGWVLGKAKSTDLLPLILRRMATFALNSLRANSTAIEVDIRVPRCLESVQHCTFRIDTDKWMHILVVVDEFDDVLSVSQKLEDQLARTSEIVFKHPEAPVHLSIVVATIGVGRDTVWNLKQPLSSSQTSLLVTTADHFHVLLQHESGDLLRIHKFMRARDRLYASAQVLCWSILDLFCEYRRMRSLYFSDEFERGTNALVSVQAGIGAEVRASVAKGLNHQFVVHPLSGEVLQLRRADRGSNRPIYAVMGAHEGRIAFFVDGTSRLWIETNPLTADVSEQLFDVHFSVLQSVAYWWWRLNDSLKADPLRGRVFSVEIELKDLETWFKRTTDRSTGLEECFSVSTSTEESRPRITVHPTFRDYLLDRSNRAEIALTQICLAVALERTGDASRLTELCNTLATIASNPHETMLVAFESSDPRQDPSDLVDARPVYLEDEEQLLDELGEHFRNDATVNRTPMDPVPTLNAAVSFFFGLLEKEVDRTRSSNLLGSLIAQHECYIHQIVRFEHTGRNRLLTVHDPDRTKEMVDEQQENELAAAASRFLIEYVSARPPVGPCTASTSTVDRLMAISAKIIKFGTESDLLHYNLADFDVRMLPSGRLGIDRRGLLHTSEHFRKEFTIIKIHRSMDGRSGEQTEELNRCIVDISDAMRFEWGIGLADAANILETLSAAFPYKHSVAAVSKHDVKKWIANAHDLEEPAIDRFLDRFSLHQRSKFLTPRKPHIPQDVFPWRMNRPLSYLRRPIIERGDTLFWGRRALSLCSRFVLQQCLDGRFQAQSLELRQSISRAANVRGTLFNSEVGRELSMIRRMIVRLNIEGFGQFLLADERGKLGDIDVLCIDPKERNVWLLECKDFSGARTPCELSNEIQGLFAPGGYIDKHLTRSDWVKSHLPQVLREFGQRGSTRHWKVRSRIITDRPLFSPLLRRSQIEIEPWVRFRRRFC